MKAAFASGLPLPWSDHAAIFAAMGDDHRQRIMLLFEPGEILTIKQLVDVMPLSRSAVLHHVNVLIDAGLLSRQKIGREVFLGLETDVLAGTLEETLAFLRDTY